MINHGEQCLLCIPWMERHWLQPTSLKSTFILSSHLRIDLPKGLFPSGLPTKTLYAYLDCSIRATYPAHLSRLNLRSLIMLREEYINPSPWRCSWSPCLPTRRPRFDSRRVRNFNFYPGIGCVSFVCVLSCVVFGGGPDIVLTTHSERPALVYLSSVLLLHASDPRAFRL